MQKATLGSGRGQLWQPVRPLGGWCLSAAAGTFRQALKVYGEEAVTRQVSVLSLVLFCVMCATAHFWTPKRWYLRSFLPVTAPNPCKFQHVLHFLNRFFVLMNAKKRSFFKKSKIVT